MSDHNDKTKKKTSEWAAFCKEHYAQNKAKYGNSFKAMLTDPATKIAYQNKAAKPAEPQKKTRKPKAVKPKA